MINLLSINYKAVYTSWVCCDDIGCPYVLTEIYTINHNASQWAAYADNTLNKILLNN